MIDTDDEVKKALNYLVGFKDEMTSDKKHYTEVLIQEVKRLREELKYAKVTIDDWDKSGPCVTVYHEGCEYVGTLRLYKDEEGRVIE